MVKISLFVTTALAYLAANAEGRAPIDPHVHRMLQQNGTANVFVTMKEKTDTITRAADKIKFNTDSDKRKKVSDDLEVHAATSQIEVRKVLAGNRKGRFTRFESFWLTNQIFIEGASAELVNELSMLASVAKVEIEESFQVIEPVPITSTPIEQLQIHYLDDQMMRNEDFIRTGTEISGINQIRAPQAWASGYNGTGVVVGIIDTGVRYTHSALYASYRGGEYSWYDPVNNRMSPYDDVGHGTHVTGTIVGSDGIGVAPGAKWIACKACTPSSCTASGVLYCLQWMYCPYKKTSYSTVRDCSKSPRVVNNSYGGSKPFNPTAWDIRSALNTLRSGGIVPIFSASNAGPTCSTITFPGDSSDVITVGALDNDNGIAPFSGKGPINGLLKPDVSAPGVRVRSANNASDTAYAIMSGTSMAAPHVTGVVALLFQQNPIATYEVIKSALLQGTNKTLPANTDTCGGPDSNIFPNNIYGFGRVDAAGALRLP